MAARRSDGLAKGRREVDDWKLPVKKCVRCLPEQIDQVLKSGKIHKTGVSGRGAAPSTRRQMLR
jgi:hypothetical protein